VRKLAPKRGQDLEQARQVRGSAMELARELELRQVRELALVLALVLELRQVQE
jgi:hypothetical protein